MKAAAPRLFVVLLVALLGLAAAGAWIIPPLLNWNRYRGEIEALVSDNLGRAVTIEGPISLLLLPEPTLVAQRVSVANASGAGGGTTLSLAELRVRLALVPLLSGRVDAQELVLRGLDMRLPWPVEPATLALRQPTWLSSISARIEDGSLSVGQVTASHINATLGLAPDTGSITAGGTAQISGQAWHITSRLTRTAPDGSAGLDLSLDGQGPMLGLGALFTGQFAGDGALSGRLSGRGPDLSRLIAAPPAPFRAEGRLSIAAGLAVADDLAVEIAGSPARGAVSLRLAPGLRLDVSLAASRLDLDAWLPALLRGVGARGRIVADMPTGIDLSSEAASLAGGIVRGLRGSFELRPDSVTLREVSAILPGETRLALAGEVRRAAQATPDAPLALDGRASLSAGNLRTTLAWLGTAGLGQVSTLPAGVLRTAELSAAVLGEIGPKPRLQLNDIAGTIDGQGLRGMLTLRPGPRLGVSGALNLDTLSLDPWLAGSSDKISALLQNFGPLDLDLQLRAERATFRSLTIAPAAIDVALESGKLSIRRLDLQSGNAHLSATGTLLEQGKIADARLELATSELGPLLSAWLPPRGPSADRLPRGPFALALQASGPPEALALRAVADLGDLHVEGQPVLDLPGGRWTTTLTLRHPGAPRFLDSIGLSGTASWLGDGSLSWAGVLAGAGPIWAPTRLASDGFDVTAGSLRANAALVFDRVGTPSLSGRITAEILPLPYPYHRAPEPLPTADLARWKASLKVEAAQVLVGQSPLLQQAAGTLELGSGVLQLDLQKARFEGGSLTGLLKLDGSTALPRLDANLSLSGATPPGPLFDLPIDMSGGTLAATARLSASGHSPAALLATLSGELQLSDEGGTLVGVDLTRIGPRLEDVELKSALVGGTTRFDRLDLSATLTNGAARITSSSIVTPSGLASLSGLLDIEGQTSELRLSIRPPVAEPPEIALRLSGPLGAPRRSQEIADALRWRAEHP